MPGGMMPFLAPNQQPQSTKRY